MSFDFRKQWLKERVLTFLNEENNYILFDNLLYRKEGVVSTLLDEFLDKPICGSHDHKRIVVFFYKTYYDKTVLEEVDVQEEGISLIFYTMVQPRTLTSLIHIIDEIFILLLIQSEFNKNTQSCSLSRNKLRVVLNAICWNFHHFLLWITIKIIFKYWNFT